jgi:hypothetical protein
MDTLDIQITDIQCTHRERGYSLADSAASIPDHGGEFVFDGVRLSETACAKRLEWLASEELAADVVHVSGGQCARGSDLFERVPVDTMQH